MQQQKQRQSLEKHMQPDSVSSKIGTKKNNIESQRLASFEEQ